MVILYTAFGTTGAASAPFNLGRTATHEVGHWLNLRHIWGDKTDCSGSDQVSDTPRAQMPNYGKPTWPHITCNNGPNGDMFMNYMDYVDDAAMFMFTHGQAARINATLAGPRKRDRGARDGRPRPPRAPLGPLARGGHRRTRWCSARPTRATRSRPRAAARRSSCTPTAPTAGRCPGPTDKPAPVEGEWTLEEDGSRLRLGDRVLEIAGVEGDVLRVRRPR